jgi:mono/diheme cytochrome c family protein
MPRSWIHVLTLASLLLSDGVSFHFAQEMSAQPIPSAPAPHLLALHAERSSPSDLELGGEIAGLPPGATRYLTREDLLALPQVSYTVTDDANFTGPTQISGVLLEELTRRLSAAPATDMVVAICGDLYHANYPKAYIAEHHPVLVLQINGQPPPAWPKDSETHRYDIGPFLISHSKFTPSLKIFSHSDEAQIPWGVLGLEFRQEKAVFSSIAPRGPDAANELVQSGHRIAQQNCFRCHNMGNEGGTKAGRPWLVLSAWATASPDYFAAYVRNPQSKNPQAQMRGNPDYDDKTIAALIAYFKTFSSSPQEQEKEKP